MQISLDDLMGEIDKYHYMYGDLMVASKKDEEFREVYKKSLAQYDKIKEMIKEYKEQQNEQAQNR